MAGSRGTGIHPGVGRYAVIGHPQEIEITEVSMSGLGVKSSVNPGGVFPPRQVLEAQLPIQGRAVSRHDTLRG